MANNPLAVSLALPLAVVKAIGGLEIEICAEDLQHAVEGHPEVTLEKVKCTLEDPFQVVQSKSSMNACLFYSIEFEITENERLFFCVVVAVTDAGRGKMITAYDADFIKTGTVLFSKNRSRQ
jgi:hypothetical protein